MRLMVGNKHWILGGDFNLIRNLQEKKRGIRTLSPTSNDFDNFIEEATLVDINTDNGWYNWTNKWFGDRHIASRLDHLLLSESILVGEADIAAHVLPAAGSDHWAIILQWCRHDEQL